MPEPTVMTMWTIYDRPADHPTRVVVRAWDVPARGGAVARAACQTFDTVDAAVDEMRRRGLFPLGRYAADEPQVVGSWV